MTELLLGDEAVGLAAIHAGIAGAFSYPGTPATEILEFIRRRGREDAGEEKGEARDVVARWSANEKVAYEEALGMSFVGHRALVSMKHVGLNVAADPFINSALTGAHGALVLAVADDPGMHSSQNEQDSRYYAHFAQVPLFEPSTQQEAYDMTREAFELSERLHLPVVVRLVTRLAHSRSIVRTSPAREAVPLTDRGNSADWTLLPSNARRRFRRLLGLQPALRDYSEHSRFNHLTLTGPRGIIVSGLANNYVAEALGQRHAYSILKIGVYPPPVDLIRELLAHCEEITVVEEGYPFIENQIHGLLGIPGKALRGKLSGALPPDGELNCEVVKAALVGIADCGSRIADSMDVGPRGSHPACAVSHSEPQTLPPLPPLPPRPPQLCKGCPHCDTFRAMLESADPTDAPILFSDIGCYTLGALPPFKAVHTCVDMGASIGMALGAVKAGMRGVVCTIGDSTFVHSGMTPLIGAIHEDADMTVVILDNAIIGMTGGQEVFATGERMLELVRGLGVRPDRLVQIDPSPKNHQKNMDVFRWAAKERGLKVIVACRPCIHAGRSKQSGKLKVESGKLEVES